MDPVTYDPAQKPTDKKVLLLLVLALVALAAGILYILVTGEPAAPQTITKTTPAIKTQKTPQLRLRLVTASLPNPTGVVSTQQASDGRLFVLDRSGYVRIVTKAGQVLPQPFLDISGQVLASGEMGLLGLAFSPTYAQDGKFFVNYVDKGQSTVIAQFRVTADANRADAASGQTVLTLKQPYPNHNGGDLAFGTDGYLYAGLGDGGSAGDPENRAQNLSSLFGKILRLDVSQLPYKIPAANPFANQSGKAGEVWDLGLRNPWRFSFDRHTHDLYIADVGQNKFEEINFEPAKSKGGTNYGWRCFEANTEFKTDGCAGREHYVFPVLQYDHSDGRCSVTGGYVYRGKKYPDLTGTYFYGDYCSGDLYGAKKKAGVWAQTLTLKTPYQITTFGQDSQGELYLADFKTSSLYQIEQMN